MIKTLERKLICHQDECEIIINQIRKENDLTKILNSHIDREIEDMYMENKLIRNAL